MVQRGSRGLYEFRGHWIDHEPGSPNLYRYWYDERSRRVARRSLGTSSLEDAKERLNAIVTDPTFGVVGADSPERVLMLEVLDHYLTHKRMASTESASIAVRHFGEWAFEHEGLRKTLRVGDFRLDLQERFALWAHREKGHSTKTISRNLSVISAALHFAATDQMVKGTDGERRKVRLLTSAPQVRFDPSWLVRLGEEVGEEIAAPEKNDWVPDVDEVARFVDAIPTPHVFRFVIILLNTWARRETIEELDFGRQANLRTMRLDLNAPGRLQTHKRRPIIRITDNLAAWIEAWSDPRPLRYGRPGRDGKPPVVGTVKKAMQAANARWMLLEAGTDPKEVARLMRSDAMKERTARVRELEADGAKRITSRALRSFMATRVRVVPGIRVEREQRQYWLGHLSQDTTAHYEIADPEYLREAAAATDAIVRQIDAVSGRSLWPEGHPEHRPNGA